MSDFAEPVITGSDHSPTAPVIPEGLIADGAADTVIRKMEVPQELDLLNPDPVAPVTEAAQRLFPELAGEEEHRPDPSGLVLGHFRVEARVGAGGMGSVFRATDLRLQRTVALKVMSPAAAGDESLVRRFMNEARSAARLDHENIARVFFIGEEAGVHFIAYEFVEGTNLRDLVKHRGRLTPVEAINFTLQLAFALTNTSASGVVHRDIKPSNVIITRKGRAKLVDLGLARKDQDDSIGDLTVAGTTLGTFDYIAPEQARDPRDVDIRSDIYSLGCTLYHMLTGEPPYPEGTVMQKLLDHQGKDAPDPARLNRAVSAEMSSVVRRMMASSPDERYQTADELIQELLYVAGTLGMRGMNPEHFIWTNHSPRREGFLQRHQGWFAATVIVLLVSIYLRHNPTNLNPASDDSGALDQAVLVTSDSGSSTAAGPSGADASSTDNAAEDSGTNQRSETPSADGGPDPGRSLTPVGIAEQNRAESTAQTETGSTVADSSQDSVTVAATSDASRQSDADEREMPREPATAVGPTNPASDGQTGISSPTAATSETPAPEPVAISVKTQSGEIRGEYPFLEAACKEARSGDVIILAYNGLPRRTSAERPIRIENKELVIRAAAGFHPIIPFVMDSRSSEPEHRLIELIGGAVDVVNVDFRVAMTGPIVADGALIAMTGSERVRLQGVNVDVLDESGRTLSVLAVGSESDPSFSGMRKDDGNSAPSFDLRVDGCWMRGARDLCHVAQPGSGSLRVSNTAMSLGGTILRTGADDDSMGPRSSLEIELEHTTCLLGECAILAGVPGRMDRRAIPVHAMCTNNIFATKSSSHPLIHMHGDPDDLLQTLVWNGNRNVYCGIGTFWMIETVGPSDLGTVEYGFDRWQSHWSASIAPESGETGASVFESVWATTDWRDLTPDSVSLIHIEVDSETEPSANPALGGATDGTNVGADIYELRPLQTITDEE